MEKSHGKKYLAARALVDSRKLYTVSEAIPMLKKTSPVKFDASCELHVVLGVDQKKSDQNVRSVVALPHGTGRTVRVIAFVTEDRVKEAKAAGATEAGSDELIEKILKGFLDFDVAVATPDIMKSLGKVAKILGQKGLMPNPKAGTVTPDIAKTIEQIKKGQVEFRIDKFGVIHNMFGKCSFSEKQLEENFLSLMKAINDVKPASIKGTYIQKISVATTMGPGMNVSIPSLMEALK